MATKEISMEDTKGLTADEDVDVDAPDNRYEVKEEQEGTQGWKILLHPR